MKLTLEWDGTDEELIALADSRSEEGLDSLDLGDAMGWVIQECMDAYYELEILHDGHRLYAALVFECFSWERNS